MSRQAPPPLADNGVIDVVWGGSATAPTNRTPHSLQTIHYRLDADTGVATCTLNEPSRLNALTTAQMWEYYLILRHAEHDDDVNVLLWTGHGRAFSAGADLRGSAAPLKLDPAIRAWFVAQGFDPGFHSGDVALKSLTLAFWDFPKPSVVAVNGLAIGGAANIALANYHDVVVASNSAWFRYPFSDIGLTPELGSSFILPRVAGMAKGKAALMLGEKISAAEAKTMGLVHEITTPADLMDRARYYAETLAEKNQQALRLSKKLINGHLREQMTEVMDFENRVINEAIGGVRSGKSKL